MTDATEPVSSFGALTGPSTDRLLAAATAATTRAIHDPNHGVLVIVLRPADADHQVIAGGGTGILRAAVSVAVGAGNDRLWRAAPTDATVECTVRSLPEVVASAADAGGVRAAHVGVVRRDESDVIDAVAIWFETWNGVAPADERLAVLGVLASAATDEAQRRTTEDLQAPEPSPEPDGPAERTWDPSDPSIDPVTGVLTGPAFETRLRDFVGDEATIILVDVDNVDDVDGVDNDDDVVTTDGPDATDAVMRTVADRIVSHCRRNDTVARLGRDRFVILLGEIERSVVLHIAKRMLATTAEPLPTGGGTVTTTVALAHQSGLVDLEEMLEMAIDAVLSGKRSGSGRLVVAA